MPRRRSDPVSHRTPERRRHRADTQALLAELNATIEQGVAAHARGELDTAEAAYRRVLAHAPDHAGILTRLAQVLVATGRPDEATDVLQRAAATDPSPSRLANLASAAREAGRLEVALDAATRATEAGPEYAAGWKALGDALLALGRHADAVPALRRALVLDPGNASAHVNLGVALHETGRLRAALASYERAEQLGFDGPNLYLNRGSTLRLLDRPKDAVAAARREVERFPRSGHAWLSLAVQLTDCGELDEALACFAQAERHGFDVEAVRANRAFTRMALGDLPGAWADYESRGYRPHVIGRGPAPGPAWDGEPVGCLLVRGEQGLGDEIMFLACVPALAERVDRLVLEVRPRLARLVARSFPYADVRISGTAEHMAEHDWDAQTLLGTAFGRVFSDPDRLDGPPSYLVPDPERAARLDAWLAAVTPRAATGLRVGICWRSMRMTADRRRFYTRLDEWEGILRTPGATFVNLQYDDATRELNDAERRFGVTIHRPPIDLRDDQEGVAALASCLDVVVSAGTAVSKLAGAAGTPVLELTLAESPWLLGTGRFPYLPAIDPVLRAHDEPWSAALERVRQRLASWPRYGDPQAHPVRHAQAPTLPELQGATS